MFNSRSGVSNSAAASQTVSIESVRRQARHRLIGASVLVAVGVIGLPLLFDTEPRPVSADLTIQVQSAPPAQSPAAPSPVVAAGSPSPEPVEEVIRPVPSPVPAPAAATEAPPVSAPVPAPPVASKASPVASSPATVSASTAAPSSSSSPAASTRLVVQVGAFAEQSRAQDVRRRLEAAGLKTYTQVANTADGPRIRVRLGPFDTRAEADRAAQAVQRLGLTASVLTL